MSELMGLSVGLPSVALPHESLTPAPF
jgi:hypothetical protein